MKWSCVIAFIVGLGLYILYMTLEGDAKYKDHKSLDAILRTSAIKISRAMVFCRENLMVEGPITYYPLYMAMFL